MNGLQSNDAVNVFDLNGALVFSATASTDEVFAMDLSTVANGTYIIKVSRGFSSKEERIVINK